MTITDREHVERLLRRWAGRERALLPLLNAIQRAIGGLPVEVEAIVAEGLAAPIDTVRQAIASFQEIHTNKPVHIIKLCCGERCQGLGGKMIEAAAIARLGNTSGSSRVDGQVKLELINCLRLCAKGPNALVNGRPVSQLDTARFSQIADALGI